MDDETEKLIDTLDWTCGMIAQSGSDDRQRIALAYSQAQDLITGIPLDGGDARPRIVACLQRSNSYRAVEDIACVGWILTAIQERVNERTLPDWRQFRKVIKQTLKLLPLSGPTMH